MLTRRDVLGISLLIALPLPARAAFELWARKLIEAAKQQIGVTVSYDPAYRTLAFPGGDVPREAGVCTDVLIRAYRDGLGVDLQKLVNADMKQAFGDYPKTWGLKRTDPNIDHRRVPNLQMFFKRMGAEKPIPSDPGEYLPGDIVTVMLPGNLPHIALVSDQMSEDGSRPTVIHNIGGGARMEDMLTAFQITGRYRFAV
jgi:uncharacterized protein